MTNMLEINDFLRCATPQAWIDAAIQHQDLLLIDHANCELKAAQSAQTLMWKYGASSQLLAVNNTQVQALSFELLNKMSKLAREELRHFEQVLAIMKKRGVEYKVISASRYAAELRKQISKHEPLRLVDTLIVGAIIEARSCERFSVLAPFLDKELQTFYLSLLKSEARHYQDYLLLAEKFAGSGGVSERVSILLDVDLRLIEQPDTIFRFHSGPVQ